MTSGEQSTARARNDGFALVLLGSLAFLAMILLFFAHQDRQHSLVDFRVSYASAICLLQHGDPYRQDDLIRTYREVYGEIPADSYGDYVLHVESRYFYLPTVFLVTMPLARLPFGIAQIVWMALIAGACILATYFAWDLAADKAPVLSGALLSSYLVNSLSSVAWGNAAGLAVSLCVIAVWCFLRERFVWAGILCLAISLALKPHDSGFVWLYFVLAGAVSRKRAWRSLFTLAAGSVPVLLWLTSVAPQWIQEMSSNLSQLSVRGAINDPGPASVLDRGACMLTNLQSVFGQIWDNPLFYNLATYGVSAVFLTVWLKGLRMPQARERAWFLLAAIAAFSVLPIYHRLYDARLLMLTVPAFALLWSRRGLLRWLALLFTGVSFILTADLPWVAYLAWIARLHPATTGVPGELQIIAKAIPVPLSVLAASVFYLAMALRREQVFEASGKLPASQGFRDTPFVVAE